MLWLAVLLGCSQPSAPEPAPEAAATAPAKRSTATLGGFLHRSEAGLRLVACDGWVSPVMHGQRAESLPSRAENLGLSADESPWVIAKGWIAPVEGVEHFEVNSTIVRAANDGDCGMSAEAGFAPKGSVLTGPAAMEGPRVFLDLAHAPEDAAGGGLTVAQVARLEGAQAGLAWCVDPAAQAARVFVALQTRHEGSAEEVTLSCQELRTAAKAVEGRFLPRSTADALIARALVTPWEARVTEPPAPQK